MSLYRIPLASFGAAFLVSMCSAHAADSNVNNVIVTQSVRHDVSAPMRDIIRDLPVERSAGTSEEPFQIPNKFLKPSNRAVSTEQAEMRYPGIQKMPAGNPAPAVSLAFEALDVTQACGGCMPPDTNGDVGDNEYIQWVNSQWAVYNKTTGVKISGPTNGNSFWAGFGGKCQTTNAGDPLVVFDQTAHRWVMSQFVTSVPYAQCFAVSTTSDPLGTYNRYEFQWTSPNRFGDYGKLGIWTDEGGSQDAYLLTTHDFTSTSASGSFTGASFMAFDRAAMLAGAATAKLVRFTGFDAYGVEPFNLIGTVKAPANACPAFVHFDESTSEYLFWNLCLNWTTPASSTISSLPERVAGKPFVPYSNEVPQLDSTNGLDPFGTHIQYHAQVRAFPAGAPYPMSLVVNHSVKGDVEQSSINWVNFTLGNGGAAPAVPTALNKTLADEGVYAPDQNNRWMGGIAIDKSGNIGVGYSVSSETMHPQIRVTGRQLSDPAGILLDEQSCTDGIANGSQTSTNNRWGDYSEMSVDPSDQCTFYFTTEYYPTTTTGGWHTRVCSFKFPNCGTPDFAIVSDTPKRVEMCAATASNPTWALRAGILNGFAGNVTLSGTSLPPGTTANFSSNPVAAPGSAVMTLANATSLPSGEYVFNADGTDSTLNRSIVLELGVSATSAAQPVLRAPSNTRTDAKIRPKLTWGSDRIFEDGFDNSPLPPLGGSDALSYTVQVATDSSFTNIVASDTVTTTEWNVDISLNSNTTYFWRVIPHNYCADGPTSATFSFTTGVPGTCPAGTVSTTVFQDNFQGGINGWTAGGTGLIGWAQGTPPIATGLTSTAWQIPDNTADSDRTLNSPNIVIPGGAAAVILSYDIFHNMEDGGPGACYDNGSLAFAGDGSSSFVYAGPERMFTDPYTGVALATTALGGKQVWCHPSATAPAHSIVDLDDYSGHSVKVQFRAASDSGATAAAPSGIYIDNFKIEVCQ
ncbi:MAG: hypothetical protein ABIR27_06510 [Dokdonella sp.]